MFQSLCGWCSAGELSLPAFGRAILAGGRGHGRGVRAARTGRRERGPWKIVPHCTSHISPRFPGADVVVFSSVACRRWRAGCAAGPRTPTPPSSASRGCPTCSARRSRHRTPARMADSPCHAAPLRIASRPWCVLRIGFENAFFFLLGRWCFMLLC
jgi:hypothetical protein